MAAWEKIEAVDAPESRLEPAAVVGRAGIILLLGWLVYAPALHGGRLWDDGFIDLPGMLDPQGWWKFWFAPTGPDYFPLTSTVQWLVVQVFGKNLFVFHALNLGLHLLGALLVWRLLWRLRVSFAWLGALLFTVHPLAVESVAWISELKNTLSLPLLLLAMLAWLDYDEHGRFADYLRAVFWFLAALFAKTSVVMLPVVLLLYAWWKYGRVRWRQFAELVPLFALSLVLGCITMGFQREWAIGDEQIDVGGAAVRIAGAGRALLFYLGKFVFPFGLLPMYPQWSFANLAVWDFLPWAVLVLAAFWMWRRRTGWGRGALLGAGFFALNLVPVLGFVTTSYMRYAWVADHFVYISLIGLIGLFVAALGEMRQRLAWPRRATERWAAAGLVLVLAWQSRGYADNFRRQTGLWAYNVRHDSGVWMARVNLGLTLETARRLPEAEKALRDSLLLRDDFYGTYLALGNTVSEMGRYREALGSYEVAARLKPDATRVHVNYGYALSMLGDNERARVQYEMALATNPDIFEAHFTLGHIYSQAGNRAQAIKHFAAALAIDPSSAGARAMLQKLRAAPPVNSK